MTAPPPRENALLFGQAAAETALLEAMRGARLHHAWMISGPEGVGKATLAFRFARRLLAGGTETLALPPEHPVFRRVAAASHADLLTIEREWDEKKKRMKKTIAAETAREIPGFLHLTPAEGGWRVVIVDGAEDLNTQSANALLKVLEEPPPRAILMLITAAPGRLLPTIHSRCRQLVLPPLAEPDMRQVLAAYLPDMPAPDRARLLALAEGSPGRALALAEQGGLKIAALVEDVLAASPGFPMPRAYQVADALRDEDPFDLFFALLRGAIAGAVGAHLRGRADAAQARLLAARPLSFWTEAWERLGAFHRDAHQHNLDRRQAVVAGLGLLQ